MLFQFKSYFQVTNPFSTLATNKGGVYSESIKVTSEIEMDTQHEEENVSSKQFYLIHVN